MNKAIDTSSWHLQCIVFFFLVHYQKREQSQSIKNSHNSPLYPYTVFFSIAPTSSQSGFSVSILRSPKDSFPNPLSFYATHTVSNWMGLTCGKTHCFSSSPARVEQMRIGGMEEIRDERISSKMGRARERKGQGTGKPIGIENQVMGSTRQE